ncbi:hypothetical protein SAMN04489844_2475 [Nocardioides exalbidus]|uniref:Uncharacterized protein n=1 Tax=Nocardioides exalbidus TaxID=402596 RepID=A0A1H4TA48_9ACTN|nr:hypothetical protein [Nocardioides exalbidus]SEC53393.1 hypothetical protein SAMN04489844_2475 [Nocardioides exalbidus]
MYDDYEKCSVCGSEVRLEPHPGSDGAAADVPAGPREGYVGAGDDPVDVRRCTNDDCPTRKAGGPDA